MTRLLRTAGTICALALLCWSFSTTPNACASEGCHRRCHGGLFGWRNYTKQERRNFPRCYGGYERYYGGFHANYFRDYPGHFDGLNNDRYGWGSGWAW